MIDVVIIAMIIAFVLGAVARPLFDDVYEAVRDRLKRHRPLKASPPIALPPMWIDHLADLNTPACRRRNRVIDVG